MSFKIKTHATFVCAALTLLLAVSSCGRNDRRYWGYGAGDYNLTYGSNPSLNARPLSSGTIQSGLQAQYASQALQQQALAAAQDSQMQTGGSHQNLLGTVTLNCGSIGGAPCQKANCTECNDCGDCDDCDDCDDSNEEEIPQAISVPADRGYSYSTITVEERKDSTRPNANTANHGEANGNALLKPNSTPSTKGRFKLSTGKKPSGTTGGTTTGGTTTSGTTTSGTSTGGTSTGGTSTGGTSTSGTSTSGTSTGGTSTGGTSTGGTSTGGTSTGGTSTGGTSTGGTSTGGTSTGGTSTGGTSTGGTSTGGTSTGGTSTGGTSTGGTSTGGTSTGGTSTGGTSTGGTSTGGTSTGGTSTGGTSTGGTSTGGTSTGGTSTGGTTTSGTGNRSGKTTLYGGFNRKNTAPKNSAGTTTGGTTTGGTTTSGTTTSGTTTSGTTTSGTTTSGTRVDPSVVLNEELNKNNSPASDSTLQRQRSVVQVNKDAAAQIQNPSRVMLRPPKIYVDNSANVTETVGAQTVKGWFPIAYEKDLHSAMGACKALFGPQAELEPDSVDYYETKRSTKGSRGFIIHLNRDGSMDAAYKVADLPKISGISEGTGTIVISMICKNAIPSKLDPMFWESKQTTAFVLGKDAMMDVTQIKPGQKVLVLMDASGSQRMTRSDGKTMLQYSTDQILQILQTLPMSATINWGYVGDDSDDDCMAFSQYATASQIKSLKNLSAYFSQTPGVCPAVTQVSIPDPRGDESMVSVLNNLTRVGGVPDWIVWFSDGDYARLNEEHAALQKLAKTRVQFKPMIGFQFEGMAIEQTGKTYDYIEAVLRSNDLVLNPEYGR